MIRNIMRKYLSFLFLSFCLLPAAAQIRFSDHIEVTMAGDTLEFTRFADKTVLVYTAALWHDKASEYAELLRLQEIYREDGLVVMELYSSEMSDINYLERTPFYLYNRGEYPPCPFTFPLFTDYEHSPFFRFLTHHTSSENFVTKKEEKWFSPQILQQPLYKWLINRRGEVVKCFDPTIPMTEVTVALKEALEG